MIKEGSVYWLFYSANLWGTPNDSIGIAACSSVVGPCAKPLDRAWHTSTDSANGQGYGGSEFLQTGSLIWMVHHGLVPGETGDYAHRRLYVDLLVFPSEGLPRVAARAPAAALADATLYDDDQSLPPQPQQAFLHLIRTVPGSFPGVSGAAAVATATWPVPVSRKARARPGSWARSRAGTSATSSRMGCPSSPPGTSARRRRHSRPRTCSRPCWPDPDQTRIDSSPGGFDRGRYAPTER